MTGESLPNFGPVLEYFTEQVTHFASNPIMSLFIAALVTAILTTLPEQWRKYGIFVSIAVSILLVFVVVQSDTTITANLWQVGLLGTILGTVTSKGYDFTKKAFDKKKDTTLPTEGQV